MKLKLYLDTSIFGGYFDDEFKDHTVPLFNRIIDKEFELIYSNITEKELLGAPDHVKRLIKALPKSSTKYVKSDPESIKLAKNYILAGVVGETSFTDCIHIALATNSSCGFID